MEDRDRDKFYSSPDASADDEEYELEETDPAVIAAEERHGKEIVEAAKTAVDIDAIYREADRNRGAEIVEEWFRNFRFQFRFQVKHLLIATAVLAIVLTLFKLGVFWPAIGMLFMFSVFGLYSYFKWEERKQQDEADRKREELYARRREQLRARGVAAAGGDRVQPSTTAPVVVPPNEDDDIWQKATTREPFKIQFSMQSLLIAMTVAAVSMGLIQLLGGPAEIASLLGFIAVSGLVIHVLGYDPPQSVILGWWFILVLYILMSLLGFVWVGLS